MMFRKIKRLFKRLFGINTRSNPTPSVIYPFVPRARNGISPSSPNRSTGAWMSAIMDVRIKNARRGKLYLITGAYGPEHDKYPCRWVVDEADAKDFETSNNTQRLISYTHRQRPYAARSGVRRIVLTPTNPENANIQIHITLNTDVLPRVMFRTRDPSDTGFAYIIDPAKYVLRPNL